MTVKTRHHAAYIIVVQYIGTYFVIRSIHK